MAHRNLPRNFLARLGGRASVAHVQGVRVVDGHSDLIAVRIADALDERVGEEERVADDPVVGEGRRSACRRSSRPK